MSTSNSTANEKIIFKDDQHAINISGKLLKLYKDDEFFDIVLIAGNDRIKIQAHKIVLSASSEYFLELFRRSPATLKIMQIKDIEGSSLKLIVDYMYSGSIELSLEKIESVLRGAVFLKMKNLVDGCCGFLEKNLTTGNCLRWLNVTKELSLTELRDKTLNYFYTNFEEATKEDEFLLLDVIELKDLLFNNNAYTDLEEKVFRSLVAWIEHDKANREHLVYELLSMVRYHYLTPKFIIENITSVSTTIENMSLMQGWLRYHFSPESRTDEEQKYSSTLSSVLKRDFNLSQEADTSANSKKEVVKIGAFSITNNMETELKSYNQELKTWSLEKRSPPFLKKTSNYSMISIDEKLYIVGGIIHIEASKSVGCIDLKTFKTTVLPSMRVARSNSQLASLNGHLCVFGGFSFIDQTNIIDSVEIFNTSTQKWNDLTFPFRLSKTNKITCHNGILYVFDFRYGSLHCYDVSNNKWTWKEQPIDDNVVDCCITGADNFLYGIFLGYEKEGKHRTFIKRFDLSKNSWFEVTLFPENNNSVKMVTVIGNKIIFLRYNCLGAVEYNIDTNEFSLLPSANHTISYICTIKS